MHGVIVVANFRATFTPETVYYHLDPLGSVRAVTSAAGAVLERHDYRPFGEDNMPLPAPGADPSRFLGQQRDQTKLDQFGARYYSMFTGRFTGVDPVINAGAVASPQRWNRYAYALNNPLRYTDTTGLDADGGDLEVPTPPCMECHEADAWMAERDALWWETVHARAVANGWGGATWGNPQPEVEVTEEFDALAEGGEPQVIVMMRLPAASSPQEALSQAAEAFGWALIGFDIANTLISPGPDTGIFGGAIIGAVRAGSQWKRMLGDLYRHRGRIIDDVVRDQGGGGAQIRELGHFSGQTLEEVARAAAQGDELAGRALKITKEAARLLRKGGG